MRFIQIFLLVFISVFSGQLAARGLPDFTGLVEKNSRAVVNIATTITESSSPRGLGPNGELPENVPEELREYFRKFFEEGGGQQEQFERSASGSGFIISTDGYVVTNHHVVDGASKVIVRLSDRREFIAEVIGSDKSSDIALLKIEASKLPSVSMGNSKKLKQGEWVLAIGSPFGLDYSVTAGIVSAKGRSLPGENYVPFIQTDVAINPGNSGGPLFDMNGKVVGINSQIYSRTGGFMGLSFSIPVELMLDVVEQLKTKGTVSRGWLGVIIQPVSSDLAKSLGMLRPSGALVSQVLDDSPAAKAGLRQRDVIMEFDGEIIPDSASLPPVVGTTSVGSASTVKILRDGKEVILPITIEELPSDDELTESRGEAPEVEELGALGLELSPLTAEQLAEYSVNSGLLVEGVAKGAGQKAGVVPGDVLVSIKNRNLDSVDTLNAIIANHDRSQPLDVLVKRNNGYLFLAITLDADEE